MTKLITFITPSRRLDNIKGLIDNIKNTADHPEEIELLIKFDSDQPGVVEFIENEIKQAPFSIRYIRTPRLEGIYSVWVGMEQLFFMSDPESYFYQIISDEPRFLTQGWDTILKRYIGLYKDNVFRLRLSDMKVGNYTSHYECTFRPDSFPIYTRRWLELTEGTGNCWGSDAYQQCVAFQLSMGPGGYTNIYREEAHSRDIPVFDIKLGGLEFCVGVSKAEQRERHRRNLTEWSRLTTFEMQEHFSYLARRINAYIYADQLNLKRVSLKKNPLRKTVALISEDGVLIREFNYSLSRLYVHGQNFLRCYIVKPKQIILFALSDLYHHFIGVVTRSYHLAIKYKCMLINSTRSLVKRTVKKALFMARIIKFALLLVLDILGLAFDLLKTILVETISYILKPLPRVNHSFKKLVESLESLIGYGKDVFAKCNISLLSGLCTVAKTCWGVFCRTWVYRLVFDKSDSKILVHESKKKKLKRIYRKFITTLFIPYNLISNIFTRLFHTNPPGVSVLYKKNPPMPGRIPLPTEPDVIWLKNELIRQSSMRVELSQKEFSLD